MGGEKHGLKWRFGEQITGEHPPGTKSWIGHQQKISDIQEELKRKLRKYNQNNCGNKIPLPIGAYSWANRPAVSPKEWIGPTLDDSTKNMLKAGGAGIGLYILYRAGKAGIGFAIAGPPGAAVGALSP